MTQRDAQGILTSPRIEDLAHVLGPVRKHSRIGAWLRKCEACHREVMILPAYPKELHGTALERGCVVGHALRVVDADLLEVS